MNLLLILFSLALLMALISGLKWHPFLAFLVTALLAGLALGLPLASLPGTLKKGLGNVLGDTTLVIVAGALLGKMIATCGAATTIAQSLTQWMGPKRVQWALLCTGFLVGIPLFYNVGFVLLVPLAFAVIQQYKLPAVYTALPMLAALSITHGFLPPHPAPMAIGAQLGATTGKLMLFGLAVALPTLLLAGPLLSKRFKHWSTPPLTLFPANPTIPSQQPGVAISFGMALLPAAALASGLALPYFGGAPAPWFSLLQDPNTVLLGSVVLVWAYVAVVQKKPVHILLTEQGEAIKDIAGILLIIAGAGALKQVFVDSQIGPALGMWMQNLSLPPLVMAWGMAALIRVAIGSATVAGLTTAGLLAPLSATLSVDPNLLVLSIGAGSLFCSHINDSGFWLFKEYFNLSVKDTLRSWTLMESVVSVVGLLAVLLLQWCLA